MYAQIEKTTENKRKSIANSVMPKESGGEHPFQFVDNRPEAVVQRKLKEMADNSPQMSAQRNTVASMLNITRNVRRVIQSKVVQFWPSGTTKHVKDQAKVRGISEQEVDDAAAKGKKYDILAHPGQTAFYDSSTGVTVVQYSDGGWATCYRRSSPKGPSSWRPQ